MSTTEEIKKCPICEDEGQVKIVETTMGIDWNAYCNHCALELNIRIWNAVPRREDFYAELMGLATDIGRPREGLRVWDSRTDWAICDDTIRELAKKYAPEDGG